MKTLFFLVVAALTLLVTTPTFAFTSVITVAAHNPTKGEQDTYAAVSSPMAKEIALVQEGIANQSIKQATFTMQLLGYRLIQIDTNICVVSKIDGGLKLVGTIKPTKPKIPFITTYLMTIDSLSLASEFEINLPQSEQSLAITTLNFMVGDSLEYLEVKQTYSQFAGVIVIKVDRAENVRRGITSVEVQANQPQSTTPKQESIRAESRRAAELISKGHDLADWYLSDFLLPYDLNYRSCSKSSLTGERTLFGATIGNILDAISYPVRLVGHILSGKGKAIKAKQKAIKDKSFARTTSK